MLVIRNSRKHCLLNITLAEQIPDADTVIQTFKACLRVSHQHLQAATLSALPPLLPLLLSNSHARPVAASTSTSTSSVASPTIDSYTLRQALIAFLSTGGIIDRLGDARERSREKARESLVILGGLAFRVGGGSNLTNSKSGKTQETASQMFERLLKEIGLTSKAWRVREQVSCHGHHNSLHFDATFAVL
jgi:CLIP-associating protein 1/2